MVRSATTIVNQSIPEAKLYLSSFSPETDTHLPGIEKITDMEYKPLSKLSIDYLISFVKIKMFGDETFGIRASQKALMSDIPKMDVYLSIGGDTYCYGEQPIYYEINRNIKKQGKKLVLWGCSIGEEDMTDKKLEDLRTHDLIMPRETITYEMLTGKGLTNVKLVADGAFLLDKEELPLPEGWKEGKMVGFNFSPLVAKKNAKSKEAAVKLIQHIIDTTDFSIALLPHVTIHDNNDFVFLSEFYEQFKATGRVLLIPDNLTAIQYKGYIARMRFFIGARTHATIAGYSTGVPTMVLGYSVKSKGIAKDLFGYERLVLNLDEISDAQKLQAKFDEMVRDEEDLKTVLKTRLPEVRKQSMLAGTYLAELTK